MNARFSLLFALPAGDCRRELRVVVGLCDGLTGHPTCQSVECLRVGALEMGPEWFRKRREELFSTRRNFYHGCLRRHGSSFRHGSLHS